MNPEIENDVEEEEVEEPALPKNVYIYWVRDGEDFYLAAEESVEGCATKDEVRLIGTYELKSKSQVSLEVREDLIVKDVNE